MVNVNAILGKSELFSGLGAASLDRIIECLEPVAFEEGQVICREGEVGEEMFIIATGNVAVSSDMGWGQREFDQLGAEAVFGEMALISNEVRSATVRAKTRVECLKLGRLCFESLLDSDPSIAQRMAKAMTKRLSALVHRTSAELLGAYRALLFSVANLTESRDPETGAHLERTRNYCVLLAEKLYKHPRFKDRLSEAFIAGIYQVSPLHDIGKVGVPDAILLKPGRLDAAEFEIMKTHSTAGAAAFDRALKESDTELFRMARNICLHHHERWDGSGYPSRLRGEAIPLEARIMAFADVYDALLSKRVYKEAMSKEATKAEIEKSSGTHFDPFVAEVFLENIKLFEDIYARFQE